MRNHRKHKRAAVAVAVAMALLITAATCGCSASTPQSAVTDFITARIAEDEARASRLTVEDDLGGYAGGEPYLYAGEVSFELEPPQVEGDRAVVMVSFFWDEESVDVPYVTRKIGNKWKVSLAETEGLWLPDSGAPTP